MRHRGLEVGVDLEPAALVGVEAGRVEVQPAVAPMRPAEKNTMSATMRLPDSRIITARRGGPSETSMLDSLAEAEGDAAVAHLVDQLVDDLVVEELEDRSRRSTSVTSTPSAANIDAYSMPITPAPTTASVRGTASCAGCRRW